jgi:hypothetical protein
LSEVVVSLTDEVMVPCLLSTSTDPEFWQTHHNLDPDAYPQQEELIKHLVYVLIKCGVQSEGVCSFKDEFVVVVPCLPSTDPAILAGLPTSG